MRPCIAFPVPHTNSEYAERVTPHYVQAIEQAGGECVRVPLDVSNEQVARIATKCDGVLLPGSRCDVNPEKYGAERHQKTHPSDPARDNVDELLLQDAYNMRKPVLGICFGLQILNVWRTGTLQQDLNSNVDHAGQPKNPRVHNVIVEAGSQLAAIVDGNERDVKAKPIVLTVNSSHHQAIDVPGDGLRVVARCAEDGIIEAVEGTSLDHFVLGVQWHPERIADDPASRAIFAAFVESARARRNFPRTSTPDFETLAR